MTFFDVIPNDSNTTGVYSGYSFVGDTVLDPFLGSGTTIKAAKELGRNSIGYEINPMYLETIKKKINYGELKFDQELEYSIINKIKEKV